MVDWRGFRLFLVDKCSEAVVKDKVRYARKYGCCLLNGDFSELNGFSDCKRHHVLESLSSLAKFLGVYEDFKKLVRAYGLKWIGKNSDDLIIERLTKVTDPKEVFMWIRQVKAVRSELADFMDFMAASGLRFVEALEGYNLIVRLSKEGKLNTYYKAESQTLEHFRFKDKFIRRTKKAFISFMPRTLVESISKNKPLTASQITNMRRKGFRLRFGDIREVHATLLTRYLNASEIDFLHGRVSASVFMRNYFNPALIDDLKERVFQAIAEIQDKT